MTSRLPTAARPARALSPTVLALCLASAFAAQAQTGSSADTVVVIGQRASVRKALAAQEKADNIVSVVSADDIGGLPDLNAAEALARLPGLAVQRDQGEGRYITIRGAGPDLNAVTINGALLPSPEASRRAVALDVLPAGMIASLEVSKTVRPEQDANALGGAVEVKTLSAFDLPGQLLNLNLGGYHDGNTGQWSPHAGALWADRFLGGTLGLAVGASAERRRFGSDNVETGGAWSNGRLASFELRDYLPVRERAALGVNLDWRPAPGRSVFVRSFASRFSDDEVRDRLTLSNITKTTDTPDATAAEGQTVTARLERRLRQRKYTQDIRSLELGGALGFDESTLALALGRSQAGEDTPESINDARFRQSNVAGLSFSNTEQPHLNAPASAFDAGAYALNGITLQARDSHDEEQHGRLDFSRRLTLGALPVELKLGAKASRREKRNDTEQWGYTSSKSSSGNYWGAGSTSLADFVSGAEVDYALGRIGAAIDPARVRARVATLGRAGARLARESALNDYTMHEDIDAGYLQAQLHPGDSWQLLVGVRHEHTRFRAEGNQIDAAGNLSALTRDRSSGHWLPALHGRWDLDARTSLRAALSHSLVRANFSQLAPGISLASATEATIGNPDLLPLRSRNLDLGVERLLGADGAASVYVFDKAIRDFAYTTNLAGTGDWAAYTTATSTANGDKARLRGIELSYQQALRQLPAPWNGLLVGVNASFVDSSAHVARYDKTAGATLSRDIKMPGQSDTALNLMLGYEAGPLSARVALNHKSAYLLELGSDILNAAQDRIVDRQRQIDVSLAWRFSKQLQLSLEGLNLGNERYYVYQGSRAYNVQYEQYGRALRIGLKASLY